MGIQRVGTPGPLTTGPAATETSQARTPPQQTVDRVAPHHTEQSNNNACCIVRCFRQILACIVAIFRTLFGSSQTQTPSLTTTPEPQQPTPTAEPAPPQPAQPAITEAQLQAQKKLEEKISVSDRAIKKINELMPRIKDGNRETGSTLEIHHYNYGNSKNLVFTLILAAQNLVFKRSSSMSNAEQETEQHFANMIKAQEVCTKYKLDLLVIPHAKKFQVYDMTFIAQQRLLPCADELQEQNYKLSDLDETVRQLAIFIAKTGLSKVDWRKIPVLDTDPADSILHHGVRRIALLNFEQMENAVDGFYGNSYGSRGLIGCLFSEKQIDIVLDVIKRHGIVNEYTTPEQTKAKRMKEIEEDQALFALYKEKGLLDDPKKLIALDLATLGLTLDEQRTIMIEKTVTEGNVTTTTTTTTKTETPIKLREVAEYVIAQINEKIQKAPNWPAPGPVKVKATRYIVLSTKIFEAYAELGLPADAPPPPHLLTEEQEMQKWLYRTLNALVEHRYLSKWDKSPNGYFLRIQA